MASIVAGLVRLHAL